jgi:hypothetical protein
MFSKSKCTIADTATDIYPKTFLETVSENQFCILAGSGYGPGSVIIQPFSGSKMNFSFLKTLKIEAKRSV